MKTSLLVQWFLLIAEVWSVIMSVIWLWTVWIRFNHHIYIYIYNVVYLIMIYWPCWNFDDKVRLKFCWYYKPGSHCTCVCIFRAFRIVAPNVDKGERKLFVLEQRMSYLPDEAHFLPQWSLRAKTHSPSPQRAKCQILRSKKIVLVGAWALSWPGQECASRSRVSLCMSWSLCCAVFTS